MHFTCRHCQSATDMKDLILFREWIYISALGYDDGYYAHQSGYFILCSQCEVRNRIIFNKYGYEYGNVQDDACTRFEKGIEKIVCHYGGKVVDALEVEGPTRYRFKLDGVDRIIEPEYFVNWEVTLAEIEEWSKFEFPLDSYWEKAMV